jgi:hypothetical protein
MRRVQGHLVMAPEPGQQAEIPAWPRRWYKRSRFVTPFPLSARSSPMIITATQILPAIVALIAGVLILLMPRLLNIVVAIYLIFIGLVGLGALRALHL